MSTTTEARAVLDTIEGSYICDTDDQAWAHRLLQEAQPWLHQDVWSLVLTFDDSDEAGIPRVGACVDTGADWDIRAAIETGTRQLDEAGQLALYDGSPVFAHSELWKAQPALEAVFDANTPTPARDLFQVTCRGSDGRGAIFAAFAPKRKRVFAAERVRLTRLAAHVTAAHRLRSAVAAEGPGIALTDHPLREAIVDPGGEVVHAEGLARDADAREAIRRAAERFDRARSRAGRADPDASVATWTALIEGRWSVVDDYDSDGRRHLVAIANAPEIQSSLALTPVQIMVANLLGEGRAQKFIAYELGLSQSRVSSLIDEAMARLGLVRRADLIALARQGRARE